MLHTCFIVAKPGACEAYEIIEGRLSLRDIEVMTSEYRKSDLLFPVGLAFVPLAGRGKSLIASSSDLRIRVIDQFFRFRPAGEF